MTATGRTDGRIHDSRSLLGGNAMVIVGVLLSLMMAFYMRPDVFGDDMLMARWWWEIVLNLQILCYAFMWFCHHNRMTHSKGWWRIRAISNFITGMVSVSYPAGILILSASMDWFRTDPDPKEVYLLILAGVALWAFGAFIMPIVNWLMVRGRLEQQETLSVPGRMKAVLEAFWPTFLLLLIAALEWWRGGLTGYTVVPVLMYVQGALPYLVKARHQSPRDVDI